MMELWESRKHGEIIMDEGFMAIFALCQKKLSARFIDLLLYGDRLSSQFCPCQNIAPARYIRALMSCDSQISPRLTYRMPCVIQEMDRIRRDSRCPKSLPAASCARRCTINHSYCHYEGSDLTHMLKIRLVTYVWGYCCS